MFSWANVGSFAFVAGGFKHDMRAKHCHVKVYSIASEALHLYSRNNLLCIPRHERLNAVDLDAFGCPCSYGYGSAMFTLCCSYVDNATEIISWLVAGAVNWFYRTNGGVNSCFTLPRGMYEQGMAQVAAALAATGSSNEVRAILDSCTVVKKYIQGFPRNRCLKKWIYGVARDFRGITAVRGICIVRYVRCGIVVVAPTAPRRVGFRKYGADGTGRAACSIYVGVMPR